MEKFNLNSKVGEVVTEFPGASEIFKDYRIDFCCGGHRPLSEAIQELNLDSNKLLSRLNSEYELMKDRLENASNRMQDLSISDLIDHIVNKHHSYLWANLPKLSQLTTLILRVHGSEHPELSQVHKQFNLVRMELEEHMIKEETEQYPALKKFCDNESIEDLKIAASLIDSLEDEHLAAGNILKELRAASGDFLVPSDTCETYELTYKILEEMESDVFEHIHLENNILFPKILALANGK